MAYAETQIRDLWIAAGGNPQQADKAVELALAASGGDPQFQRVNDNGTIDRGLWAINSTYGKQSSVDPMENARAAVALSADGTDWEPWKWLADKFTWIGGTVANKTLDLLGVNDLTKLLGYVVMAVTGVVGMGLGVILMLLSSRKLRQAASFAGESVGMGVGFGIGGRLAGLGEGATFRSAPPVSGAPVTVPLRPPPSAPPPAALPPSRFGDTSTMELPWLQTSQSKQRLAASEENIRAGLQPQKRSRPLRRTALSPYEGRHRGEP